MTTIGITISHIRDALCFCVDTITITQCKMYDYHPYSKLSNRNPINRLSNSISIRIFVEYSFRHTFLHRIPVKIFRSAKSKFDTLSFRWGKISSPIGGITKTRFFFHKMIKENNWLGFVLNSFDRTCLHPGVVQAPTSTLEIFIWI